jgi:anthranilate phosphoribosyltransferase
MDEVTTTTVTEVLEIRPGGITGRCLTPEELGLPRVPLEALRGGNVAFNAQRALDILGRAPSDAASLEAQRQLILANAACVLYIAGHTPTIEEGVSRAKDILTSGRALQLLQRVKAMTQAEDAARTT